MAKIISSEGRLPALIHNDHIYFAGGYEHLHLWFRFLSEGLAPVAGSSVDLMTQSAATTFTWLNTAVLSASACRKMSQRLHLGLHQSWTFVLVFAGFALWTVPHFMTLANAKPEVLFIPMALLALSTLPFREARVRQWLVFGLCLGLPLSFKVTWVPVAASLGLAAITSHTLLIRTEGQNLKRFRVAWNGLLLAGVLSAVVCLPFLWKGHHFFGNPIHPVQFGPLASDYWNETMRERWHKSSYGPSGLGEYLSYFFVKLPISLVEHKRGVLLGLVLLGVAALRIDGAGTRGGLESFNLKRLLARPCTDIHFFALSGVLVCLLYSLLVNFFIDPLRQLRFDGPVVGLLFGLLLLLAARVSLRSLGLASLIVLASGLSHSGIDLKFRQVRDLFRAGSWSAFVKDNGTGYRHAVEASLVNAHRKIHYPDAAWEDSAVLSNIPRQYLYDALMFRWDIYDLEMIMEKRYGADSEVCSADLLKDRDVRYGLDYPEFEHTRFHLLTELGERLEADENVYWISDRILELLRGRDRGCDVGSL